MQLAARRTSDSSLKGKRSSKDPPPRVMMMTSTSSNSSSSRSAADTSTTAAAPCTATSRISNSTAGQRRRAFSTTSFSASVLRPQIRPTLRGNFGKATLRSALNKPSAAKTPFRASRRASNSPTPTWRISFADIVSDPFLVNQDALAWITTRAFAGSGCTAANTFL
ncbi:unannotated protein [freshwater metagenome]|uniref:Unannotated protein n=1 Tax=freshwater metagenome TaxID=449393 RepID=A0A6J7NW48_9ZZZZ